MSAQSCKRLNSRSHTHTHTHTDTQWRNDGVAASDGGPTGGRGPPTVLEFLVINCSVCLVLLKLKNAKRHNQELAKKANIWEFQVGSIS